MLAYRRHMTNVSTLPLALYLGAVQLLQKEFKGQYPGGQARRAQRWNLLAAHSTVLPQVCWLNSQTDGYICGGQQPGHEL
jgi:hypothetical protein